MGQPVLGEDHLLTRILFAGNRLYSRTFHRVRVLSPCPLPREGPAIVICNHISSADPFLVQGTCHRVIRWMMAKEYFDQPVARTLCGKLGFIPVVRGGRDPSSLKAALRTLHAGNVLGIFPEGRISPTDELLPFQSGLGLIAARTGVPVYPVIVERVPRNLSLLGALVIPHEAKILYGTPVQLSEKERAGSGDFRAILQQLQQQALATGRG